MIESLEATIADLESKLQAENEKIAKDVEARQIGGGYWHTKRRLEEKLITARSVLAAVREME